LFKRIKTINTSSSADTVCSFSIFAAFIAVSCSYYK
jgi:hypothetical protein